MKGVVMLKEYIAGLIKEYVRDYQLSEGSKTGWREPLVGFASAADPLFAELKRIVGEDHRMPGEILPGARTVISYFIPFSKELADTNREGLSCSKEWAAAYVETNKMMARLNRHLVKKLEESGFRSAVVDWHYDRERLSSNWSQRHVAYIAGLGTFGINNMLITGEGCCGRYSSIVTTLELEPDLRPAAEFCLYKKNGSCGACVRHCVCGALKPGHFDRKACYQVCMGNARLYSEVGDAEACGKCLTDVPCSFANPSAGGRL